VALVGLVTQIATWRSAHATQGAMIALTQRLDRLQQLNPSPRVASEATAAAELAADAGDDAVQAALSASVLFAAMVGVLGLGFWYNRRRLAGPFSYIAQALQRVAEGQFVEPLREDQPGEFGAIARGVNHMARALAWREALQAYLSQLLVAPRRPVLCSTSLPTIRTNGRPARREASSPPPAPCRARRCAT